MGALSYLFCGVLAVLGRILGQMLGARWSVSAHLREVRLTVLMDAWRRIERASVDPRADDVRALEHALSDVQLVGTPAEVALAAKAARSLNRRPGAVPSLDELLHALRVDVRAEMRLRPAAIPASSGERDRSFAGARIWPATARDGRSGAPGSAGASVAA